MFALSATPLTAALRVTAPRNARHSRRTVAVRASGEPTEGEKTTVNADELKSADAAWKAGPLQLNCPLSSSNASHNSCGVKSSRGPAASALRISAVQGCCNKLCARICP